MTNTTSQNNKAIAFPASLITKATLITGALDICLAFLYSYIKRGTSPVTVLQYIAKVLLGKEPGMNPLVLGITGLLIHFLIALAWTILFFILYSRLNFMQLNKILTGIVYGLFVWAMMNILILPLWNNKPFVFNAESAIINAVILILAIGLPLSFIAHRFYFKKNI